MGVSTSARVGGAMGSTFVIAYIATIALTRDAPDGGSSDEKIADSSASRSQGAKDPTTFLSTAVGLLSL
jgi:hypothetical protein